jgi:hypothetical protein
MVLARGMLCIPQSAFFSGGSAMSKLSILLAAFFSADASSCRPFMKWARAPDTPRSLPLSYKAGDHLHRTAFRERSGGLPHAGAASFVDATNVENTNDLGRLLSEQVASRLSQLGYSVTEIQLRSDELRVDPGGGVFACPGIWGKSMHRCVRLFRAGRNLHAHRAPNLRQRQGLARGRRRGAGLVGLHPALYPAQKPKSGGGGIQPSVKTSPQLTNFR